MGRKPINSDIMQVLGNPSRKTKEELERRSNNEHAMAVSEPDKFMAPNDLTGEARNVFYDTKAMLKKMGILHNADLTLVVNYSRTVELANKLWSDMQSMPYTLEDTKGKVYNNPTINEWRRTTQQVTKLASELGFTQASRASLANKQEDKKKNAEVDDEFESEAR